MSHVLLPGTCRSQQPQRQQLAVVSAVVTLPEPRSDPRGRKWRRCGRGAASLDAGGVAETWHHSSQISMWQQQQTVTVVGYWNVIFSSIRIHFQLDHCLKIWSSSSLTHLALRAAGWTHSNQTGPTTTGRNGWQWAKNPLWRSFAFRKLQSQETMY